MNLLRSIALRLFCPGWFLLAAGAAPAADNLAVLQPATYAHYVEKFNAMEDENITNFVSNADSWSDCTFGGAGD